MAKKKGQSEKKDAGDKRAEPPVPKFHDEEGILLTLKGKDFPSSLEGKLAYCDYQVEKWKAKKEVVARRSDPLAKKKAKLARIRRLAEALDAEIAAEKE